MPQTITISLSEYVDLKLAQAQRDVATLVLHKIYEQVEEVLSRPAQFSELIDALIEIKRVSAIAGGDKS